MISDAPTAYHYQVPELKLVEDGNVLPNGYEESVDFYLVDLSFQSASMNCITDKIRVTFNRNDGSVADLSLYRFGFRPMKIYEQMKVDFNDIVLHIMSLNYYTDILPYYEKLEREIYGNS